MKRQTMMQFTWFARALLLLGLIPLLTGCPKTTGGGWFLSYDEYDDAVIPISLGFTAQVSEDLGAQNAPAKGRLAMVAHHLDRTTTRIQGEFDQTGTWAPPIPGETSFIGVGKVNGESGYALTVQFQDYGEPGPSAGDGISIRVWHVDTNLNRGWEGYLEGGNIRVHKEGEAGER